MKIIAYDNFKPGVTLDDLKPYLREEVANVWRLWKAGIVRENYTRADVDGVIIVFELESVEAARRYTNDFPLSKAGLLEWHFLAFDAPLPLEHLADDLSPQGGLERGGHGLKQQRIDFTRMLEGEGTERRREGKNDVAIRDL